MMFLTTALTRFSEVFFLTLVEHPSLAVMTMLLAIAIWVLPGRLLKDTPARRDIKS